MITRCRQCNKPIALNKTAWTCGPMFCSHGCGVEWAKTKYGPEEYMGEIDLSIKAKAYFNDIAEEISREDYGARVERYTAYSKEYDMSTVFEQVFEGDELVSITCVGWHFGEPNVEIDEECIKNGMTALFVED